MTLWQPVAGDETRRLLEHLDIPEASRRTVQDEALSVLSRCIPPTSRDASQTGLVIGYVQSGKTMSFTTLAALARDNGYRLIVVATGITTNLFEQSSDRIERDLRLDTRKDKAWQFFRNPQARPDIKQRIASALNWNDTPLGFVRQTVLVTVMKNRAHLDNLAALLSQMNLQGVPALIIDDEADQASLNNKVNRGMESATYRRIVELRRLLPHHTFLQYTATPQALLLINLIDVLSPGFAAVLTPGTNYAGGKEFFEGDFRLIQRIPGDEIPSKDYELHEPPDSLLEALKIFFIGAAAWLKRGGAEDNSVEGNRSMLVHPSKETMQHASYVHWIREVQRSWAQIFALPDTDPDYRDLLDEFRQAYEQLAATAELLPPFADLVPYLKGVVQRTTDMEMNATRGRTPEIPWQQDYFWILVGGEVLNRGFTVEGLTVTYMPRSKGVGNADTIEQRARWFGYKADYLGYCRVYLADGTLAAYRSYVEHEEDIRRQMKSHVGSLREWRRAFFISPDLRPTRHEVLDLDYMRGNFSNNWFDPKAPHDSDDAIGNNRDVITGFLAQLKLVPDVGHSERTDMQRHLVASNLSLELVYRDLLTKLLLTRAGDSQRFTGLLLQLASYLENNDAPCTVYQMSAGTVRERTLNDDDEIPNLFQGENPLHSGEIYPGDRQIRAAHGVTVQIHSLRLLRDKTSKEIVANEVPAVAVWVPKDMAGDWLSQAQGGR